MNPISSAASVSSTAQSTVERRDHASHAKVVTAIAVDDEQATISKRAEAIKTVKKNEKSERKARDEERMPKDQHEGHEEGRGHLTDVYI